MAFKDRFSFTILFLENANKKPLEYMFHKRFSLKFITEIKYFYFSFPKQHFLIAKIHLFMTCNTNL